MACIDRHTTVNACYLAVITHRLLSGMRKLSTVFGQIVQFNFTHTSKFTHTHTHTHTHTCREKLLKQSTVSNSAAIHMYRPCNITKLCTLLHREFMCLNGIHNKETAVPCSELNGFSSNGELFSAR